MVENNFYNFICFPNLEQRNKIRSEYFDTKTLRIDFECDKKARAFTFKGFSRINSLEKISNHLNNAVSLIDCALLKAINYFFLLEETDNEEIKNIYELLFRIEIRNLSFEIYCYEEKLLEILMRVFRVKRGKDFNDFIKKLKCKIKRNEKGEIFNSALDLYIKKVKIFRKFRNNETHGITLLFMDFEDKNNELNNQLKEQTQNHLICLRHLITALKSFLVNMNFQAMGWS